MTARPPRWRWSPLEFVLVEGDDGSHVPKAGALSGVCCEVLPEHRRHRLYCNPVCRAKSYRRWRFFLGLDPLNIVMATQLYRERPPPAPAAQPSVGRAQRRVYRVPTGTMTIDLTDLAVLDLPAPVRARLFATLSQLEALDAAERRVASQKAP